MSENLTLLCVRDGDLYWTEPAANRSRPVGEEAVNDSLREQLTQRQHRVVFAAPAGELRLLEHPVSADERRHLADALPFMLEERLSQDVEELHFARRDLDAERVGVAVVTRAQMNLWQELLGEFASQLPWVPDALLLPWAENEWTVVFEGDSVLLRYGVCLGAQVSRDLLGPLVSSIARDETPQRLVVYGSDEVADRKLFPENLQAVLEWRRGGFEQALLLAADNTAQLDLRQGEYVPRLPYERWWAQWRSVAALLAVAVLIHGVSGWLDYRRLERQNLALRQEIESLYREVNPRGAIVDAEKQLRRQLGALNGGDSGVTFSGMLAPLGAAMSDRGDMLLASLNYSQRSGELRINLLASDFVAVEGLRQDLVNAGLEATLENSSRSGDRVRARLRIGDGA